MDEIYQSINLLKNGKACGQDGISAEFYKCTKELISPYLLLLFNNVLDSGVMPKTWCESVITPIYKSGAKHDPNNYRGISLINVLRFSL